MLVVADSSALVALAAAGSLNLLDELFDMVRIPPRSKPSCWCLENRTPHLLQEFSRGKVLPVNLSQFVIVAPGLGAGEVEAMALYKALSADQLLIDDERARKVARLNQIQVVGSMGVLLLAKHAGLVPAAKPLIMAMQSAGIHLSARLVLDALPLANE